MQFPHSLKFSTAQALINSVLQNKYNRNIKMSMITNWKIKQRKFKRVSNQTFDYTCTCSTHFTITAEILVLIG